MDHILYIIGVPIFCLLVYEITHILWYAYLAVAAGKKVQPVSQLIENPKKRTLVIGDSTSYGTGATEPRFSLVGRLVHTYPEVSITNESKNALDLRELSLKLNTIQGTYDVVLIHIGGIDTLKFTSTQKMEQYFLKINEELDRLKIPTRILITVNNVGLAPIMQFMSSFLYRHRSNFMHNFFVKMAQKYGMRHVSLYELPGKDPLSHNTKQLFSKDKMHPSDEGYGIWFSKIDATLKPLL